MVHYFTWVTLFYIIPLYFTIFHSILQYSTLFYYIPLYSIVFHPIILYSTLLYYIPLYAALLYNGPAAGAAYVRSRSRGSQGGSSPSLAREEELTDGLQLHRGSYQRKHWEVSKLTKMFDICFVFWTYRLIFFWHPIIQYTVYYTSYMLIPPLRHQFRKCCERLRAGEDAGEVMVVERRKKRECMKGMKGSPTHLSRKWFQPTGCEASSSAVTSSPCRLHGSNEILLHSQVLLSKLWRAGRKERIRELMKHNSSHSA